MLKEFDKIRRNARKRRELDKVTNARESIKTVDYYIDLLKIEHPEDYIGFRVMSELRMYIHDKDLDTFIQIDMPWRTR